MDYFLKTTSKEAFLSDLQLVGLDIELIGDYYQDDSIIIDWIGTIPDYIPTNEFGEPTGEAIVYDGDHLNIRSNQPIDTSQFQNTQSVHPQIPYRVFS